MASKRKKFTVANYESRKQNYNDFESKLATFRSSYLDKVNLKHSTVLVGVIKINNIYM